MLVRGIPEEEIQITRLPTESRNYVGLTADDGEQYAPYKVGPTCSVPGCARLSDHGHHIVRRSELGGPFFWVRMPDGQEWGNLTGLCFRHHEAVTENKSRIMYVDQSFVWLEDDVSAPHLLVPQPPRPTHEEHEFVDMPVRTYKIVDGVLDPDSMVESEPVTDERPICPGCGRKLPKPKIETPKEDRKPRGTWAIAIPMDERENGADVLDEMLEGIREKMDGVGLSYSEDSNAKYYVLSTSMGLLLQHFDHVVADA